MPESLCSALEAPLNGAAGVMLAVSHDHYTHSVGGAQILVSDEQLAFNACGGAYLHIAPRTPRLSLAPGNEAPFSSHATLDGAYVGTTTYAELAAVLAGLRPRLPNVRRFVLHCLLGHQAGVMALLYQAIQPQAAVFWVNDYETICPGSNLLRTDVEFCGAPPLGSFACRVCTHGPHRAAHVRQIEALFAAVPLLVVAPSAAAQAVWQAGAHLPHLSVLIHEHAAVTPLPDPDPPAVPDAKAGPGLSPVALGSRRLLRVRNGRQGLAHLLRTRGPAAGIGGVSLIPLCPFARRAAPAWSGNGSGPRHPWCARRNDVIAAGPWHPARPAAAPVARNFLPRRP